MAEEPEIALPSEEQRRCPACGTRVAVQATTCLMCGASLVEAETAPEEEAPHKLPTWIRALIVIGLALIILAAVGFGIYTVMTTEQDPTPTPTQTPTNTPIPTPTQTSTPSPSPTPIPPIVHQVQEGETLITIAELHGTTVEAIVALNPGVESDLIQVGQILLIPVGTPTPAPTATLDPNVPTPTPGDYLIHVVEPGETLITIGEQYGVSVALLHEVNDMPIGDTTIFVNQTLIIPLGTPQPTTEPTVDPNATPTLIPPYPAPPLLSPSDGAIFVGDAESIVLQWSSVSVLNNNEWYRVSLFHPPSNAPLERNYTRATAWHIPFELLTATGVGEFRWDVRVVRETRGRGGRQTYREADATGESYTFTWLEVTPTPSLTPSSTPTATPTSTPTLTPSATLTSTITSTVTSVSPTATYTPVFTLSPTPTH
ncbi:MAG: LysM peptidoglycan-binding domain-containing protein [Chloroflexota bacterium]|nr:LysM peptidoglycan-binding domain-containing protein [Chloroflexota bacterium]